MNRINPRKLLNSKWTAVRPVNKEKHFIVTELILDEEQNVVDCVIEAVLSKRAQSIDWAILCDDRSWQQGWK